LLERGARGQQFKMLSYMAVMPLAPLILISLKMPWTEHSWKIMKESGKRNKFKT